MIFESDNVIVRISTIDQLIKNEESKTSLTVVSSGCSLNMNFNNVDERNDTFEKIKSAIKEEDSASRRNEPILYP